MAFPEPKNPFRPDILNGRVCLVTGGATGIGYSICEMFGKHGCKIAIMARRKAVIDEAVAKLGAMGIDAFGVQGDVKDPDLCVKGVNEVAAHFGRLDFLVNNAAGNFMSSLETISPNGFATVIGIDLQGVFHMSQAALPHLKKTGATDGAVIINITAYLQDVCTPFQGHAAAAKAGIDVLTNTMGCEWAEYGVRAVSLAPGGISGTEGGPTGRVFGVQGKLVPTPEKLRAQGIMAGRWGRVEDISLAALFLVSGAGNWITATRLIIDGASHHRVYGFGKMKAAIAKASEKQKEVHKSGAPRQSKL